MKLFKFSHARVSKILHTKCFDTQCMAHPLAFYDWQMDKACNNDIREIHIAQKWCLYANILHFELCHLQNTCAHFALLMHFNQMPIKNVNVCAMHWMSKQCTYHDLFAQNLFEQSKIIGCTVLQTDYAKNFAIFKMLLLPLTVLELKISHSTCENFDQATFTCFPHNASDLHRCFDAWITSALQCACCFVSLDQQIWMHVKSM